MINRRTFLNAAGSSALLRLTTAAAPVVAAGSVDASAAEDYRALVCVFMFGGNDGFNMVVPRSDAEYGVYAASRQNLAVAQDELLAINPINGSGVDFGLHPSMATMQGLFESGRAAFVSNVGPLVEPTTKDDFFNRSVVLPPQLFSHNDQQDQWQSLKGVNQSDTGWAGRVADVLSADVTGQLLPTNLSTFGTNLLQSGSATVPYVMGPGGPLPFLGFGEDGLLLEQRLAFERVIAADYTSIFERAFAGVQQRAVATADLVNEALTNAPALTTVFPASVLGQQLTTVARLIASRETLEMKRQVFFLAVGGFDTHDDQLLNQPTLLGDVSDSIAAFFDATVELGVADCVTTFTQSDFGRTLTSNGDGTDHAWGSNHIVVGDAVLGQDMYGTYPSLDLGGELDVGGGRIIPTTSADQYVATLANWIGVAAEDLPGITPHIGNFATQDLGFLG